MYFELNFKGNSMSKKKISTLGSKLGALGPGILMASAAVGGSHIIASTQAGAIYGWQLAIIIILANLFKYPFFRFGTQYTLDNGHSLLTGYYEKGRFYIGIFLVLSLFAAVVNTAAVSMITAAILSFILPFKASTTMLSVVVLSASMTIILLGRYSVLDTVSKLIMITLTATTVWAVLIAFSRTGFDGVMTPDFIEPSPWQLGALGFIIALMGWMPAPIEISALNSMWVIAKKKIKRVSYEDGLLDFNVGYVGTAILALVFLALGALVQYGSGVEVETRGVAYINQFINMYAATIGEWARGLIAFIAFMCMFGTTITVVDGYSRVNCESIRLVLGKDQTKLVYFNLCVIITSVIGFFIISMFNNALGPMVRFAMIASFVTTPIFAWLNLSLVLSKGQHKVKGFLYYLSITGLAYLSIFALFFITYELGLFK